MYFVSVLFCNSLWGKYGQRPSFRNKTCFDRKHIYKIAFNDKYEPTFEFLGNKAVLVNYKHIEETLGDAGQINIDAPSYTMAYARMRLYKALHLLGDKDL